MNTRGLGVSWYACNSACTDYTSLQFFSGDNTHHIWHSSIQMLSRWQYINRIVSHIKQHNIARLSKALQPSHYHIVLANDLLGLLIGTSLPLYIHIALVQIDNKLCRLLQGMEKEGLSMMWDKFKAVIVHSFIFGMLRSKENFKVNRKTWISFGDVRHAGINAVHLASHYYKNLKLWLPIGKLHRRYWHGGQVLSHVWYSFCSSWHCYSTRRSSASWLVASGAEHLMLVSNMNSWRYSILCILLLFVRVLWA